MSSSASMQQAKTETSSRNTEQLQSPHEQGELNSALTREDSRLQATTQRRVQNLANNSTKNSLAKTTQRMAHESSRTSQLANINAVMKAPIIQCLENEEVLQEKQTEPVAHRETKLNGEHTARENNTGLPDKLKSGIESLSGLSLDHVRVHYNSSQPAQLHAHAYAQGNDIHIAPGQEKHLPHEAWHVVQQAQGRVKPNLQMKSGVPVNDDSELEAEADVMGAKALQMPPSSILQQRSTNSPTHIVQRQYASDAEVGVENLYKPRYSSFLGSYIKILGPEKHSLQRIQELSTSDIWLYDFTDNSYQSTQRAAHVYIRDIQISDDTSDLKQNISIEKEAEALIGTTMVKAKPGYLGEAIVYSGEKNAASLANKYIEGTQDWDATTRKSRIGVNFGINKFADFDVAEHTKIAQDVAGKAQGSFDTTKDKASTNAIGFTWGYSFKEGGLPGKRTTADIRTMIETGFFGGQPISWKKNDEDHNATKEEVLTQFRNLRKSAGIPYGMLRSLVGEKGDQVQGRLEANNAKPVYIHSLDADAPDFETLKQGEEEGQWKKVLDAYDEIIETTGSHDMIIGGYNLLANPEAYSGKDYEHTIRSNVIDLAIRQAVHSVAPSMTYPTEPNFLIKASLYKEVRDSIGPKKNVWGDGTSEGRALYDRVLKHKNGGQDIHYDPLASVPTGVDAGGARLKLDSNKTYDKDSILGKPQDSQAKVNDKVSIEDQYIVQAQSLAGASRLATAYVAAYLALGGKSTTVKKQHMITHFASVEKMVRALLSGNEIRYTKEEPGFADDLLPVHRILDAIQIRLQQLQQHPDFDRLVE